MEDLNAAIMACFNSSGRQVSQDSTRYSTGSNDSLSVMLDADMAAEQARCAELIEQYSMLSLGGDSDEDQLMRDTITYYLMGVGGMTLCCLGLIGNMISLVVLSQKNMKSSTYSYLSALAVCDSLVLLCTIILLVKDVHQPEAGAGSRWMWNEGAYPYLFPYVHPLAFMFQVTSIWLTLSFTVDRYIMICHPFRAEPFCTISRARKVIICQFVCSLLFNLPKFFEYQTVPIHLPDNKTKIGCDLTPFGRSPIFRELYHSWLYIVFVCGVPFLALAIINAFLIHAVRLSRKRGREINAAEKKKNDTTIMLIGVVITFFICQMPALVSRLLWAFEDNPDTFKQLPLYTLNEIGSFLIVLNSAINIVPYYFFGARFRKHFWMLFCCCLFKYSAFKKLTRSFSLTVIETERRPSSMSFLPRHSSTSQQTIMLNTVTSRNTSSNQDTKHTGTNSPKKTQVYLHVTSNNGYNQTTNSPDNIVSVSVAGDGEKKESITSGNDAEPGRDTVTHKLLGGPGHVGY